MGCQVRFSPGHDIFYLPSQARSGGEGESTTGGYYVNAAQAGEAPGRWLGKGAAALGLAEGTEVDPDVHEMVFSQVDPHDGVTTLGRAPAKDTAEKRAQREAELERLLGAEPHATEARKHELERQAAQMHRASLPYTDFTVTYSKSVSVVHASIRENARRAAMAGDLAGEAWWADVQARYAGILFEAAAEAMRHLDKWAVTRVGMGRKVDDQQLGRYGDAGLVASMWLQGTSRDGDPHDHVHNAIARMSLTSTDDQWRAVDTWALRQQGGVAKLLANAYHPAAFSRGLGLGWVSGPDGTEVNGVTQAQKDAYSSRKQVIDRETARKCAEFEREHGRAPARSEVRALRKLAEVETRKGKDDAPIDWDELAAQWDAQYGGDLAQIALDLGLGPGGAVQARAGGGEGPSPEEQTASMAAALARVQAKHAAWNRGQLCGELADCLPASIANLEPAAAIALALDMANRIIAGEVQPVVCLDAPDMMAPPVLRRDLDGRSIFTRPGVSRYATEVQLSREEKLLERARQEDAPRLSRAQAARPLGAQPAQMDAQLLEPVGAAESSTIQPCGLSAAQQAAAWHVLTSPRRCEVIEAPAGAGKTHVLAALARMFTAAGIRVYGTGPTQQSVHVLQGAAAQAGVDLTVWNTARLLGQRKDGTYRNPQEIARGSVLLVDEGSMVSLEHYARLVRYAAERGAKVITAGDPAQLKAVEGSGGLDLLASGLGVVQLPDALRFREDWEKEASLRLRAGDPEVLTEYADHGRITGAPPDEAKALARKTYVAEYLAGRAPLMMAASNELVDEMNAAIRDDLRHLGLAQSGGPEVELMNGQRAGVGDPIVLRQIHHNAESGERGRGLANGDLLRIESIDGDRVMVRRQIAANPLTGERRYSEPFQFDYAAESQLGHAVTEHRAQGSTVTAGISLFTGSESPDWAYPALTRGALGNYAIVFTRSPNRADPRPGTRKAPELVEWARVQNERAALDKPAWPDPEAGDDAVMEALGILSGVLERPDRDLSATQHKAHEAAQADHLAKLHVQWQHFTSEANRARYEAQLRAALPEELRGAELTGTATWLWRTLRQAEAAGLNSGEVIREAVGGRGLGDARDLAAVVDSRIRKTTAGVVPLVPRPWAERVPDVPDPVIREHLGKLAAAMDARTERLAAHVTETAPAWAVQAAGPVPEDPMERLEWQHRIAPVAAYREFYGWEHPTEPIGPEPAGDLAPEKRAAWHGAFAALGPAQGLDLRGEPDARLHLMRGTYGSITRDAPRFVGRELRWIRTANRDSGLRAVRHEAEAKAARERGDDDAAERHAERAAAALALTERGRLIEAQMAAQDEAYREYERGVQHDLHLARAADTELRRRYPGVSLPPLRSAEPAPPSAAERAELLYPERVRVPERADAQQTAQAQAHGLVAGPAETFGRWLDGKQPEPEPEPEHGHGDDAPPRPGTEHPAAEAFGRWLDRTKPAQEAEERPKAGKEPEKEPEADREGSWWDPPKWVEDSAQRAREAQEKLADRESVKIPDADPEGSINPEAGDIGSAWPGMAEPERDAILQPAKPEIEPSPEIADRVAEPEHAYTAPVAGREAGE